MGERLNKNCRHDGWPSSATYFRENDIGKPRSDLTNVTQEARWLDAPLLDQLAGLEQLYKAGNKTVAWEAIDLCGRNQLVMPNWLRDAVSHITLGLRSGELGTFDAAFDVKLVSKATRRRKHALGEMAPIILGALIKHRLEGGTFNSSELDAISKRLQVPRNYLLEIRDAHPFLGSLRRRRTFYLQYIMSKRHGDPTNMDYRELAKLVMDFQKTMPDSQ